MTSKGKIAIIGSGLIGRNWAIIFTSFGYNVQLFDSNKELLNKAPELIRNELHDMCSSQSARGNLTLEQRMALVSTAESLKDCLSQVIHVQECVFEDVALKQAIFKQVDELIDETNTHATLASSTSFCMPSVLFKDVSDKHIHQCLVAHPINPPAFVRLVELVLHPKTSPVIVAKTRAFFAEVGQKPVVLKKEVPGFALNVLQTAVLHQCYSLVKDGIVSAEDIDTVVTDGLGPRYAFIGPWMTAHLNAQGMAEYFEKYSEGLFQVAKSRPEIEKMQGPLADQISQELATLVPLDKLQEKRAWRDKCLKELDLVKAKIDNN